jgi:hypothetical protein
LSSRNVEGVEDIPLPKVENDKIGDRRNVNLDRLEQEVLGYLELEIIPEPNGLGSCKMNRNGFYISTKYCARIDKTIIRKKCANPDNYVIVSESELDKTGLGKNISMIENNCKLIFIPYYTDTTDASTLMWCCRFFKALKK